MKRIKIMGLALVAVVAMGALFASMSSGKTVLTLKTAKGALAAGAETKAFSSNLLFVTADGALECSENTLTGTLTNNGSTKDKGKIATEVSEGAEAGKLCKSALGPVSIKSEKLPWADEFKPSGELVLDKIEFIGTFPGLGGATCGYEAKKVISHFATSGPVTITTTHQVMKGLKKGNNPACPTEGYLEGTFNLTSGGEVVSAEI